MTPEHVLDVLTNGSMRSNAAALSDAAKQDDGRSGAQGGLENGPIVYFECQHLDETVSRLKARGIEFDYDPQDQPWLWREGRLKDPDGNRICLFSAGVNRKSPPWRIRSE